MFNDIDKCTAMLFDSEGEYPFALPPVSLVPGTFVLLILFMLPPAKKFVFFCNRGVIPIRFCPRPRRPCRKSLLRIRFFHSRDISVNSARVLTVMISDQPL